MNRNRTNLGPLGSRPGIALLLSVLGFLSLCGTSQAQAPSKVQSAQPVEVAPEYRLRAGDLVRINVYQSPDLALEARVGEAGTISYPLLGSIKIGGLSLSAAEDLIAKGLRFEVLQPAMGDALRDGDVAYVRESLF